MSRRILSVAVVGAVAFGSATWLAQRRVDGQHEQYDRARRLDDVVAYVSSVYVDSVTERDLYELAIDGMLQQLGDPYTDYLVDDDLQALAESSTGNYVGVGIRIESSDGLVTVVTPLAGTPADDAGILPGDRIIEIDGRGTRGWTTSQVAAVLRGSEGDSVEIVALRPGMPVPLRFRLVRAHIHVNAVRHAELVSEDIGYVWLETVSDNSAAELQDEISRLRAEGARKLILDVRWNPGGLLTEAIAVADLFLQPGDLVVETRGRDARLSRSHEASAPEPWPEMPLVVLVNEYSASAAEIIAGAVQDHDRGLLIGAPTFGKGLVQTVFPLGRERALKITTGRWYTPSGRSIQRGEPHDLIGMADSTIPDVDTVHTDSGRSIPGGGGIQPDILADRGTERGAAEDLLVTALGGKVQEFQDALSSFALAIEADTQLTDPDVRISTELREQLRRHLAMHDIVVADDVWRDARSYIDREVSYRLLRYAFGFDEELRRRTADDELIGDGVRLLSAIETTDELFATALRR